MNNGQSLLGTIRLDVSFEILKDYLIYIFLYNYHLIIMFGIWKLLILIEIDKSWILQYGKFPVNGLIEGDPNFVPLDNLLYNDAFF